MVLNNRQFKFLKNYRNLNVKSSAKREYRDENVIPYHKNNLVYTVVFLQFLTFQQNNSAQTSVLIFFTSRHYYFVEKLWKNNYVN